jgi:dTDP-4-amino-4,6-dideoxygalactose transaminase
MVLAVGDSPVRRRQEDGNIDESSIEAAISTPYKAILPVHLFGRLALSSASRPSRAGTTSS